MHMRQLKYFEIVESGSLSGAARQLFIRSRRGISRWRS